MQPIISHCQAKLGTRTEEKYRNEANTVSLPNRKLCSHLEHKMKIWCTHIENHFLHPWKGFAYSTHSFILSDSWLINTFEQLLETRHPNKCIYCISPKQFTFVTQSDAENLIVFLFDFDLEHCHALLKYNCQHCSELNIINWIFYQN